MNFKPVRKVLKISGLSLLGLILFILLFLFIGLKIPAVQKQLGKSVSKFLSKKIETEVDIDKIAIHLFDRVALYGAYFEDQNEDTLLSAKSLIVDIDLKKLISKKVEIDKVKLDRVTAKLEQVDSTKFNFQYIIDAFSSGKKSKKQSTWEISAKNLTIDESHVVLDLITGFQDIYITSLLVDLNKLDLQTLDIEANKIALDGITYKAKFTSNNANKNIEETKKTANTNFPLNTVPIKVTAKKLSIENTLVDIITGEDETLGNTFNPQHIYAEDLNVDFKNIVFDSTGTSLTVDEITTELGNYLDIQHLSGHLKFAEKEISATQLELKTERSIANLDAVVTYPEFADFLAFNKKVDVSLNGKPIDVHIDDISYFVPSISKSIDLEKLPDDKINLNISAEGTFANLNIKKLNGALGSTKFNLSGGIQNPTNIDKLYLNNIALSANSSAKEIQSIVGKEALPIDLKSLGKISLRTRLNGDLQKLNLKELVIKTDAKTNLNFSGQVENINDIKNLNYNLAINEIQTEMDAINKLIDSLPDLLNTIQTINYTGKLIGSTTSFDLDGKLTTNLGTISPNLKIDFNEAFTYAVYKGNVSIDDFEVGTFLKNDSIGNLTMEASVDGEGLSLDTIDTDITATVESFVYNSYEYNNLKIDGHLNKRDFEGDISIDDENIAFNFNGQMGINDGLPDLNFELQVDTINLFGLNLSKEPASLSFEVTSDIGGGSIENLKGNLTIKDIRVNKNGQPWTTDSLHVKVFENEDGENELNIESEIINGFVAGNYTLNHIVPSVLGSVNEYFPLNTLINIKSDTVAIPPQSFKADLKITNIAKITDLIVPSLEDLDSASIIIDYDSEVGLINIDVNTPEVTYNNMSLDNLFLKTTTNGNTLNVDFGADSLDASNNIFVSSVRFKSSFTDGAGEYGLEVFNDTIQELGISGKIRENEGLLAVDFDQDLILDQEKWDFIAKAPLEIGKSTFSYPSFDLIKGDEGIFFTKQDDDLVDLYFESFEIDNISKFLLDDSTSLDGSISGSLILDSKSDPLTIDGDLFIAAIQFNGIDIGSIGANFQNIGDYTTASIQISDLYTDVSIEAILSENQNIDAEIEIIQFDMKAIQPFARSIIDNVDGRVEGYATIGGSLEAPEINGLIDLKNVEAHVVALNAPYKIREGTIDIEKDKIVTDITFVDSAKRKAILAGSVEHDYFKDIEFDLNLSTKSFTFLDSKDQSGLPFYGKLNAELDADITGSLQSPEIFAIFATQENTDVAIKAINNTNTVSNEPYVIFVDKSDYTEEEVDSIINFRYKIKTIFDLTVYANINDNANLRVIIDPVSGDYLDVKGNGNLVVDVTESGELLINGVYEVTEGEYRFTFQDFFLKRSFNILPGGQITFVGDVMSSNLDIEAAYILNTSTYGLIKNEFESLSDSEKKAARDPNTEVRVVLSVEGELLEPQINFDIRIPESSGNVVNSSVSRALERLRNDKTELNTQVFSLLLLQSFSNFGDGGSVSAGGGAYNAGAQIAFSSVSTFLNNQLKKLTSKAEGLEVGLNLASSSDDGLSNEETDGLNTTTNIDVFIKQSLLNDRLVLELGTNVDLDGSNDGERALTGVAGDFVLEYKLTKEGNLRLNVFQKSDYNILNDNNVWKTGIGLSYEKTFGKIIKDAVAGNPKEKRKKARKAKQNESLKPDESTEPQPVEENKENDTETENSTK